MKVAELAGLHQFRLTEAATPLEPGPGEIQVAVKAIGICGSDIHYFAEGSIGDTACVYPMVLGHEPAGVVRKTGPGVSGWEPGDPAVLEPAMYCYHCEFCITGHHNVCANIRFLSTPGEPGFFREFVNLPARNVLPLPGNLSCREGTLVEPLSVVLNSMKFAALRPGETAAVLGGGPIGLLTVAMLKLSGARRVWCVEPVPYRREMARALGADAVLGPEQATTEILRETHGRGVDVAFDCAAKPGTHNEAMDVTRNAGRVVLTGIPSETHIPLAIHVMRRKELALFNVRRSNHDSETALQLLSAEPARFIPMLTHEYGLERIQTAFETLESYSDGAIKSVVAP